MGKSKGKSKKEHFNEKRKWCRSGSLAKHMANVERNAPPLTLQCLAYRTAKWKFNMIIPNHITEPAAYPSDCEVKQIRQVYDEAKDSGYNEPRYFVKHGLWGDLDTYLTKFRLGVLGFKDRCFICYLRKTKYPFIERDPPHDYKIELLCRKRSRSPKYQHFVHHYYGYKDNKDFNIFLRKEKFPSFIPFTQDDLYYFANRRIVFYIPD